MEVWTCSLYAGFTWGCKCQALQLCDFRNEKVGCAGEGQIGRWCPAACCHFRSVLGSGSGMEEVTSIHFWTGQQSRVGLKVWCMCIVFPTGEEALGEPHCHLQLPREDAGFTEPDFLEQSTEVMNISWNMGNSSVTQEPFFHVEVIKHSVYSLAELQYLCLLGYFQQDEALSSCSTKTYSWMRWPLEVPLHLWHLTWQGDVLMWYESLSITRCFHSVILLTVPGTHKHSASASVNNIVEYEENDIVIEWSRKATDGEFLCRVSKNSMI